MSSVLENLSPGPLWDHFGRIAQIPRPSKKEERIAEHVVSLAKKAGLETETDAIGNIVVRKPASKGREKAPMVVIQGHLDMVCEKNRDVQHDFDNDPIQLERVNGDIKAKGTTLGSDNGIGVASALSIMLDKNLPHGPLEFLFTLDEETGMTGAMGLRDGFLKSRILLNLDSEEEGSLYVGCAGGRDTVLTFPVRRAPVPAGTLPYKLEVLGLKGGHSGVEIHIGRANAIKFLARILHSVGKECSFRLGSISGGSKRNAIPREAEAVIFATAEDEARIRNMVESVTADVAAEYAVIDTGVKATLVPDSAAEKSVISTEIQNRLLRFLHVVPHGVVVMSADIPGLVETSTNMATATTEGDCVILGTSQRSSVRSSLNNILDQITTLGEISGAHVSSTDGYPGWKPNLSSVALKAAKESYRELFGKEPEIKAIHAGLECGIIGERFPGMDMVSFGPTINGAHSPDERVNIASVQKFWDLLLRILDRLSR